MTDTSSPDFANELSKKPTILRRMLLGAIVIVAAVVILFAIGVVVAPSKPVTSREVAETYVAAVLKGDDSHKQWELQDLDNPLLKFYDRVDRSWLKVETGYRIGDSWGKAIGSGKAGPILDAYLVPFRARKGSIKSEGNLIWMVIHVEVISNNGDKHIATIALRPSSDSPVIELDADELDNATNFTKWGVVPMPQD